MKRKLATILEQYAQYSVFIYILLLLIGGLIFVTWQWIATLKDSRNAWAKVAEVEELARHKDDSLDVFKLNHAEIEIHDRRTWNHFELSEEQQEKLLRGEPFLVRYRKYYEPDTEILQDSLNRLKSYDKAISDTLDSLYRERAKLEIEKTKLETEKNIWKAVSEKWSE